MLSLTRITANRISVVLPRATVASGSSRMFSIGKDIASKEKVEEDRYIRAIEHEAYLKRKAAAEKSAPKLTAEEEAAKKVHDAAVADVFAVLAKTGDKISDEGVEALVAWKLGA